MSDTNVLQNFPEISQSDEVRNDITYEFDSDIDVYNIKYAPALRVFSVTSNGTTFTEGADYDLIQNANGNYVKIDWGIGGSSPSNGDIFTIDQEFRSVISRYIESHDEEFDSLCNDLDGIIAAKQVDNATGQELDRIGELFGRLGQRSGRGDQSYRAYLKSVVQSFNGRGSRSGLKFAISAAVGNDPDDIIIQEDIKNLEYTIKVTNANTAVVGQFIDELAELADPSGVDLNKAILVIDGNEIRIKGTSSTVSNSSVGLGGNTLTLDGNSQLT